MSLVPMFGYKFRPIHTFAQDLPHYYTNMGLTAENVAVKYEISREEQDAFPRSTVIRKLPGRLTLVSSILNWSR